MTDGPDAFDAITAALSGDKRTILKEQLTRIKREELERIVLEILTRNDINDEVADLRNEILKLSPEEHAPDDTTKRRDRLALKKEVLDLTKEERDERRMTWRDVQNLKREE